MTMSINECVVFFYSMACNMIIINGMFWDVHHEGNGIIMMVFAIDVEVVDIQ